VCLQVVFIFFFFFQAEDGIRDGHVTGVQTCALPISLRASPFARSATGVFLSRVVSATPTRTSAPPATSHPVSPSLRSVVASTTPTTGWKFMKTAERLGPTTLTAR